MGHHSSHRLPKMRADTNDWLILIQLTPSMRQYLSHWLGMSLRFGLTEKSCPPTHCPVLSVSPLTEYVYVQIWSSTSPGRPCPYVYISCHPPDLSFSENEVMRPHVRQWAAFFLYAGQWASSFVIDMYLYLWMMWLTRDLHDGTFLGFIFYYRVFQKLCVIFFHIFFQNELRYPLLINLGRVVSGSLLIANGGFQIQKSPPICRPSQSPGQGDSSWQGTPYSHVEGMWPARLHAWITVWYRF